MARLFDDTSLEYLQITAVPVSSVPLTMACWFYSDDITIDQVLMSINNIGDNINFFSLGPSGAVGGDPVQFAVDGGGTSSTASTSTGYSANTWHHACAVAVSATDRRVFIDGGSKGTNVTSEVPSGLDTTTIGRFSGVSKLNYMSGRVAEAAIWNIALSDAEQALLAKGFSPLFFHPESIVAYWPLIRDDDNDLIGGYDLTAFNTPTVATHPPKIIYPTHKRFYSIPSSSDTVNLSLLESEWPLFTPFVADVVNLSLLESEWTLFAVSIRDRGTLKNQQLRVSTPGQAEYKVRLKNQAGTLVAEFDNWRSLMYTHRVNAFGSCRLEFNGDDARKKLFELDGQIEVWRRNLNVDLPWYLEWEGFHRTFNENVQIGAKTSYISFGLGYAHLLSRRIIGYPAGSANTDLSGASETVQKAYVNQNAGALATVANGRFREGAITGLSVEADAGLGNSWTGSRAYKNLFQILQDIAEETGVDFSVVNTGAGTFEFRTHLGQLGLDRTTTGLDTTTGLNSAGNAPVIFSNSFGNMILPTYKMNRSNEVNVIQVLGQGVEDDRQSVIRQSADIYDSPWNDIEGTRNATGDDSQADGGLNSIGDEELYLKQKKETLKFTAMQIPATYYGKHYKVGDLITARFNDSVGEFNKQLVQAKITVSKGAEGEKVRLEFGDTVNA